MNSTDATKLLEYLEQTWKVKMGALEKDVWRDAFKLTRIRYTMAVKTLKLLYEQSPPTKTFGKLPAISAYKTLYNTVIHSQLAPLPKCPCCNSTTFVAFYHVAGEYKNHLVNYDCPSCWLKVERPRRSGKFEKDGFLLCDNEECRNPDRETEIMVTAGSSYYWQFLKKCIVHGPTVTEIPTITQQPMEHSADVEIPF